MEGRGGALKGVEVHAQGQADGETQEQRRA